MDDSPVLFIIITHIISSISIPRVLVRFFGSYILTSTMSREGEEKETDSNQEILGTKESIKLDTTSNISWNSLPTKYKGDGP